MKQLNIILSNAIFALQILLLFLVIFERNMGLPPFVQTFGRMHPLLLHMPIGLLILLGLIPLIQKEIDPVTHHKFQGFILHFTSLTAVTTALFGLFLAQEGGYGDELIRHKWTGIVLNWLIYVLLLIHTHLPERKKWFAIALISSLALVVLTGHFGANLTHGKGYLLEPIQKEKTPIITDKTTVYVAAIEPILKTKCIQCHNERKSKGKLIMTSLDKLLTGGDNGPVWIAGDAKGSHLIQRIHLPLEDEDHMPPQGKPQLTSAEIQLLFSWIEAGANALQTLGELTPGDSLYQLLTPRLDIAHQNQSRPMYTFKPASQKAIESLNNPFRTVTPIAANSPALNAHIFVRQAYKPQYLEELSAIKEQLVSLNLSNLPIKDEELSTIALFPNLEELILNGTAITGAALSMLRSNSKLRSLALSNTKIDIAVSDVLPDLTALEELFIWNTGLSSEEISTLQKQYPHLKVFTGFQPKPGEELPLSAPILNNKETVIAKGEKVELKHNFPGVTIRYTTDGSEPDSLTSSVYESPFEIDDHVTLKVKAFHEGWLSSSMVEFSLFQRGWPADSIIFLEKPDPQFPAQGVGSLQDAKKGDNVNFRSGAWLGYRDNPFSTLFYFSNQEKTIQKVVVSYLQNMGSYIMPPVSVEVWAGNDINRLQLMSRVNPESPLQYGPNAVKSLSIDLPPSSYAYYKIVAERVRKLPPWHNGKGDRGWFFVDEVFFY